MVEKSIIWLLCFIGPNALHFEKKAGTTFDFRGEKNKFINDI